MQEIGNLIYRYGVWRALGTLIAWGALLAAVNALLFVLEAMVTA